MPSGRSRGCRACRRARGRGTVRSTRPARARRRAGRCHVAGPEHLVGEHGEHQHHARADAEHRLGQQQGDEQPAPPGKAKHDAQRAEGAAAVIWRCLVVRGRREPVWKSALMPTINRPLDRERGRVEHERDVTAERRGHKPADRRAHREHHSPRRAEQHVRLAQLVLLDEVGECRGRSRLEERRADGQQRSRRAADPERARVAREQERRAPPARARSRPRPCSFRRSSRSARTPAIGDAMREAARLQHDARARRPRPSRSLERPARAARRLRTSRRRS